MISRVFSFIGRYLFRHPVYLVTYIFVFFRREFHFNIRFFTLEQEVDAIKAGKSVIRLGDGDIVNLLLDLPNVAGRVHPKIKGMIQDIIRYYDERAPYILSVPVFINMPNSELAKKGKGKVYWGLGMKVMFLLKFRKDIPYMDAHNFYYDNYFEDNIAPLVSDKKIVLLANGKTIEKQKDNPKLPFKKISYVETPPRDAIDAYDSIMGRIENEIRGEEKENVIILAAMGPVGKYILFEYAYKGYQGIDIGKVAEVMFTGESIEYLI